MNESDLSKLKELAFEQFVRRLSYANMCEKIDNSGLHAGQPMYFYCRDCGVPTETLPEDFLFPPISQCGQCKGLEDHGWLREFKNKKNE